MKIRAGIIGCGKVAHVHAKALTQIPEVEFSAVQSRTQKKGKQFASEYGVESYTDIKEMVQKCELNMVVVCTPHPNHAESSLPAIRAGAHVIIEKPLAVALDDCDTIIKAAEEQGVKLSVISQRRFYQPVQRLKKALEDGKIGKPVLATIAMHSWRDEAYYNSDPWRGSWKDEGGGALINQAPHQLDLMLWFMGEIEELYGSWANFNHPYIDVEDTAIAAIRFKSGALGTIIVSNSQNPALHGKVTVFGDNGATVSVKTEGGTMFVPGVSEMEEGPINDIWTVPGEEQNLQVWQEEDDAFFKSTDPVVYYMKLQLEDFALAILNKREPLVTVKEGRNTVELIQAIYKSEKKRELIRFPL